MRSVVVVLPASMCAAMPMFRYMLRGVARAIVSVQLPAIMREGAVGVGHLVGVFALLDGAAAIVGGIHQLARQAALHGGLIAAARGGDQPADGKRTRAIGAHFDRHLVGGTTDAARAHFERRRNILERIVKDLDR